MHRVDTSTAAAAKPAPDAAGIPGYFTRGDPGVPTPATVPGQDWFNAVQEELVALIEAAGLSPDTAKADFGQAAAAAKILARGGAVGFRAKAQDPASLSLDIEGGAFFNTTTGLMVTVAADTVGPIAAPGGNPRNDIVYIDALTGAVGIATGVEDAAPTDPALTAGKMPIARIAAYVGMIVIAAADLFDIRYLTGIGRGIDTGLVPDASKAPPEMANNTTDAAKDIDFDAGYCRADNSAIRITSTAMTKQIDASWVAGTNAGGLSSSLHPLPAAATTLHCFDILVGGVADFGFDTDPDAANLIADHSVTDYRRRGSILTDATPDILPFYQFGDRFVLVDRIEDYANTTPGAAAVTTALTVPTGIEVIADIVFSIFPTGDGYSWIASLEETDNTPSQTYYTLRSKQNDRAVTSAVLGVKTNTSGQIHHRHSNGATAAQWVYSIITLGWIDSRGRNA